MVYGVLGFTCDKSSDVTQEAIRSAYRELAFKYHPDKDKSEGSTARFQKISAAYIILQDPVTRSDYDAGIIDERGPHPRRNKTPIGESRDPRPPETQPDFDEGTPEMCGPSEEAALIAAKLRFFVVSASTSPRLVDLAGFSRGRSHTRSFC